MLIHKPILWVPFDKRTSYIEIKFITHYLIICELYFLHQEIDIHSNFVSLGEVAIQKHFTVKKLYHKIFFFFCKSLRFFTKLFEVLSLSVKFCKNISSKTQNFVVVFFLTMFKSG